MTHPKSNQTSAGGCRFVEVETGYGTPCQIWTGTKTPGGYGLTYRDGKRAYAHRVAYEQLRGAIPKDLTIDHLSVSARA